MGMGMSRWWNCRRWHATGNTDRRAASGNRQRASSGSDKLNKARKYRRTREPKRKAGKTKELNPMKREIAVPDCCYSIFLWLPLLLLLLWAWRSRCANARKAIDWLTEWLTDGTDQTDGPGRMRWQIDQRSLVKLKLKVGLGFGLRGCSHWSIAGIVVATATHTLLLLHSPSPLPLSLFLSRASLPLWHPVLESCLLNEPNY